MASGTSSERDATRQLEDVREQQRAISDVLRAVARSAGLEPVLDEIVEACRRLCHADYGALYLLEDGLLHVATHQGEPGSAEYDREHPHALDRTTGAGRTAVTGQPVHIPDVRDDPEYAYPGPYRYRALLGVPIKVEDELLGVVVLVRREPEAFSDAEIALVQTFADQAAIALANAVCSSRLRGSGQSCRGFSRLRWRSSSRVPTARSSSRATARAYITCLFCDLRGFTAFAETAAPEELLDVLREYHTALGRLIPEHGGTLEHFAGDGLMVFFNDPLPVEDHELHAVRLAVAAQERFAELAGEWHKRGVELGLGIGVEAGYATLGRIGFEGRYDYGAVGPVTNLASRLSTRAGGGQTLVGPRVFAALEARVETAPVGELPLEGFGRPIATYEVRGLR